MLKELMENSGTLVAAFCETHLNPSMKEAEISMEGYSVFRADRHDRIKGGVVVYLRKDAAVDAEMIASGSNGEVEYVVVYSRSYNLAIANVYRPPATPTSCFTPVMEKIRECISELSGRMASIVICGDFNLPGTCWETGENSHGSRDDQKAVETMMQLQNHLFMSEIVQQPTRGINHLDLCFTNCSDKILDVETEDTVLSDHKLVFARTIFECRKPAESIHQERAGSALEQLNFFDKSVDWAAINLALSEVDWELKFINKSVEVKYDIIHSILEDLCIKHVPKKRSKKRHIIPRDRRILMKKRSKLLRKEWLQGTAKMQKLGELEEALQKSHLEEERMEESAAVASIKQNYKYFFKYVKRKGEVRTSIGPLLVGDKLSSDPAEICEELRQQYDSVFSVPVDVPEGLSSNSDRDNSIRVMDDIVIGEEDFIEAVKEIRANSSPGHDGIPAVLLKNTMLHLAKPLCILWNESLRHGQIPSPVKIGKITPIYKGGDKRKRKNYRPVSLTSHIIKLVERVIAKKVIQHLEAENLYNNGQHGFRRGRSCLSQLLQHYQNILEYLSLGQDVDVVYLDFSKAFDKVDHNILLAKLKNIGISEQLCVWISSFLKDRKQFVAVEGSFSAESSVISGVPQGTVLGPLLFLIFIADISDDLTSSTATSFADDTRVMKPLSRLHDCEALQEDLGRVYDWARANNMSFNGDKFELLRYSVNNEAIPFQYLTSESTAIEAKTEVTDLGVLMSSNADFKSHIEHIIKKAKERMSWIFRVFLTREPEPMLTLYRALVLPILEYCSQLWHPVQLGVSRNLEAIQRSFTSRLRGVESLNYWERLEALKLYSLERRRERYMAIYIWKIIVGLVPNLDGTRKVVVLHSDRRGRTCRVPPVTRTATAKIKRLQEDSLPVLGARLFNCLPRETRGYNGSLESLKVKVDSYLRTVPDNPTLPHYYQEAATNSLFNQVLQMQAASSRRR